MRAPYELFLAQSRSDFRMFRRLDNIEIEPCDPLHYLQMATEKLAKADYLRSGQSTRLSHLGFVRFLRMFINRSGVAIKRIAPLFHIRSVDGFLALIRSFLPLAHSLESLAPAIAGMAGPNPEYPWPSDAPTETPCDYPWPLWDELRQGRGRQLVEFVGRSLDHFEQLA